MPTTRTKALLDHPLRRFWADPRMFATSLLAMLIDCYDLESVNWAPETIEMTIEEDFGLDFPQDNYERLMVGIALLTTNSFYVSLPDFASFCVVLAGHQLPPGQMMLPDADDAAWGITEGMLLAPPDEKEENPFNPEITAFIGSLLDQEGILTPPDVLRIATRDNDPNNRVQYEYSDDPTMFSAVYDMEKSKTDAINQLISGRMRGLIMQLRDLPLRTANKEKVQKLAVNALKRLPGDDSNSMTLA